MKTCYIFVLLVSSSYAVSAGLLVEDNNDVKARLAVLEASLTKVLEKNEELERRVTALEDENVILKKALTESQKTDIALDQTTAKKKHRKHNGIAAGDPSFESAMQFRQNKRQLIDSTVAFTAVLTPPYITVGPGQTIVYDGVITNVGGAYDHTTGIFTAPVSGVYAFNFAEMVDPGHNEYLELVKDGVHVIWNYGHAIGATHYVSSSRTVTVVVNKDSQVWVRTQNIPGHHGTGRIHGNSFTTFGGWIIEYTE